MSRKIVLLMIVVMSVSYGKFDSAKFFKKVRHADPSDIRKTVKTIDNTDVQDIAKKVKLSKMTPEQKLTTTAEYMSKNDKFAAEMIDQAKDPLAVLAQYSRYGTKYVETTETITKKVLGIPLGEKTIKKIIPTTVIEKIYVLSPEKGTKQITGMFGTKKDIIDRYVEVLKRTGKKGFKISKDIADYTKRFPKSTAAGVLFVWFLADPNGFDETLEKSGDNVSHFAGTIAGTAVSAAVNIPLDAADKVGTSLGNSIKNHLTFANVLLILILGVGYLGWKFRERLPIFAGKIKETLQRKESKKPNDDENDKDEKLL